MKSHLEVSLDRANEAIRRLMVALDEERKEKAELLRKLAAVEQKPVVIPLEVADAIELLRSYGYSNYTIIDSALRGFSQVKSLDTWTTKGTVNTLMSALINGYTVETLESKIEKAVLNTIDEVNDEAEGYILTADTGLYLSQKISEAVAKVIREDQAATQQQ